MQMIPSQALIESIKEEDGDPMKKYKPERERDTGRYKDRQIVGTNRIVNEGFKCKSLRLNSERLLEAGNPQKRSFMNAY